MTTLNQMSTEFPFPKEGIQYLTAGDLVFFTINVNQVVTNDASLDTKVYLDNTYAAGYTSGSTTVDATGLVVTTEILSSTIQAGTYVMEVYANVGGMVRIIAAIKLVMRAKGDL